MPIAEAKRSGMEIICTSEIVYTAVKTLVECLEERGYYHDRFSKDQGKFVKIDGMFPRRECIHFSHGPTQ